MCYLMCYFIFVIQRRVNTSKTYNTYVCVGLLKYGKEITTIEGNFSA
jgi:hypothetical protein